MNEHPIEGLMLTAMNSIQDMIDVNTIIGEPMEVKDATIIPISKVSFGFAAGGSEFKGETINAYNKKDKEEQIQYRLPFGGGAGAGVTVKPVAFLIVQSCNIRLLPVEHLSCTDKILDYIPDILEKINNFMNKCMENKNQKDNNILKNIQNARFENARKEFTDKPEQTKTDSLNENQEADNDDDEIESDGEDF